MNLLWLVVLRWNKGLEDLSVSAVWGLSVPAASYGVQWYVAWCLRLYRPAFLQVLALSLIFFSFPRDFENNVCKDKDEVKNILYPFFLPVSVPDKLVSSYSLVVLLAWSNPFLLSSCPSVCRLSPWLIFQSRRIRGMCMKENWGLWEVLRKWEVCLFLISPRAIGRRNSLLTGPLQQTSLTKTKCKDFIIFL